LLPFSNTPGYVHAVCEAVNGSSTACRGTRRVWASTSCCRADFLGRGNRHYGKIINSTGMSIEQLSPT
jgi:hypothetical protein